MWLNEQKKETLKSPLFLLFVLEIILKKIRFELSKKVI